MTYDPSMAVDDPRRFENPDWDALFGQPVGGWMSSLIGRSSSERKAIPLVTGLMDYFPDALVEVARVSKAGNDKHNPGEPLHWTRGRSTDHADSIGRHLLDRGGLDPDTGMLHTAELAWRGLALLQEELEQEHGAQLSRASVPAGTEDRYHNERSPRREVHIYDQLEDLQ